MKKVLFITFFWPPSGKATIHWPLMMIKYLPEYGWQPSVLTVDEDTFSEKDESLLKEISPAVNITKTGYFDPFIYYRKFLGKDPNKPLIASETISKTNRSLAHRLSIWIRMNLFVPDARVGWYNQAVIKGKTILETEKIDRIVTIGPPHSTHLIGRKLSKTYQIPHIPVLIDPWVDIVYYKGFNRNKLVLKLDNHFEKLVMKDAARVIFVTKSTLEDFIGKYPWIEKKAHVLYWGYNEENFSNISASGNKDEEILLHAGNIFDYQNPPKLWNSIKREVDAGRNIKLKFLGTVSPGIKKAIEDAELKDRTEYLGFLPYQKVVEHMCSASYLLVCATEKRHVPGKLFEYLRTGKPILAFGNDNEEVKQIIETANAGMLFPYINDPKIFFDNVSKYKTDIANVKKYDRKSIAGKLAGILTEI